MAEAKQPRTLADKLERLFATVYPASRGPYSNDEAAAVIREQGGPTISSTYIWLLRKGQRTNPTMKHLEAMALLFGVPPAYFFDDDAAAQVDAELELLAAIRDLGVQSVALRMAGLSERSLASISEVVERVRELEGLPASEDEPGVQGPQGPQGPRRVVDVPRPTLAGDDTPDVSGNDVTDGAPGGPNHR